MFEFGVVALALAVPAGGPSTSQGFGPSGSANDRMFREPFPPGACKPATGDSTIAPPEVRIPTTGVDGVAWLATAVEASEISSEPALIGGRPPPAAICAGGCDRRAWNGSIGNCPCARSRSGLAFTLVSLAAARFAINLS